MAERVDGLMVNRREAGALAVVLRFWLSQHDGQQAEARQLLAELEGFVRRTSSAQVSDDANPANPAAGQDVAGSPDGWNPDGWITPAEAAALAGVTPKSIRQRCRLGVLTAVRREGRWRIDPSSVTRHGSRRDDAA